VAKLVLRFEADSWDELMSQLRGVSAEPGAPSAAQDFPSDNGEDTQGEPASEPTPEPAAAAPEPAKAPKTKKVKPAPPPTPEPEPQATEIELPSLEALKTVVTQAVRAAQQKKGTARILELLPAFKAETGLEYVMNAQNEHRPALYSLLQSAGVETV